MAFSIVVLSSYFLFSTPNANAQVSNTGTYLCTTDKSNSQLPLCTSTVNCTPAPKDPTGTQFICPSNTPPPQTTRAIVTTLQCDDCIRGGNIVFDSNNKVVYFPSNLPGLYPFNTTGFVAPVIRSDPNPLILAYDSNSGNIYGIPFTSTNTIFVVDPKTNILTNIDLGVSIPYVLSNIAFNPVDNKIYVDAGGYPQSYLFVIDVKTNTVVKTMSLDVITSDGIGVDTNTGNVYVVGGNKVAVIDGATDDLITTMNVSGGNYPRPAAFDPVNGYVYIANNLGSTDSVSAIDTKTNTLVSTIPIPAPVTYPTESDGLLEGIAFNPVDDDIYTVFSGSHPLVVIDTKTNTLTNVPPIIIPVNGLHWGIAVDHTKDNLFIAGNPPVEVQLNPSPPKVAITQPVNGSILYHLSSINGTASDDIYLTSVTVSVDGSSPQLVTYSSGTWTLPVTLSSGEHTVNATATGVIGLTNKTALTHFTLYNPSKGKVSGEGKLEKDTHFEFNVQSKDGKTFKGHLEYQDKSAKIDLDSKNIPLLSVYNSFSNAAFVGQANLSDNDDSQSTFIVKVTDIDKSGDHDGTKSSDDTFSIIMMDSTGKIIYQNSGIVQGHVKIDKLTDDVHDNGKQEDSSP